MWQFMQKGNRRYGLNMKVYPDPLASLSPLEKLGFPPITRTTVYRLRTFYGCQDLNTIFDLDLNDTTWVKLEQATKNLP